MCQILVFFIYLYFKQNYSHTEYIYILQLNDYMHTVEQQRIARGPTGAMINISLKKTND
jgi:hypothetical protein